jgi:hypothetical protein
MPIEQPCLKPAVTMNDRIGFHLSDRIGFRSGLPRHTGERHLACGHQEGGEMARRFRTLNHTLR